MTLHRPLPAGLIYQPDILTPEEEHALLQQMRRVEFKPFEFHGYLGKRRIAAFGWRYLYDGSGLQPADPIPDFLYGARAKAGALAGHPPEAFEQALLTEYPAGATIGWHRDRSVFDDVVGLSLATPCTMRFRRRRGAGWDRAAVVLEPRSGYVLHGPVRHEWEHSIPAVEQPRYSITFRTLRAAAKPGRR